MSKITSKLQVTVPKALAKIYGLHPGSKVTFDAAGEVIRLIPSKTGGPKPAVDRYAGMAHALKLSKKSANWGGDLFHLTVTGGLR